MFEQFINFIYNCFLIFIRLFFVAAPALLVILALQSNPALRLDGGKPIIKTEDSGGINDMFIPNTRWSHLAPCGVLFDEQEEFQKAKSCVNTFVWPESPIDEELIPRCFIVTTSSPDVHSTPTGFNGIIVRTLGGYGAIVGFYQPETKTIFIIENIDADQVYRHELQHFFLHLHDPESQGLGHFQDIWQQCEPPYYSPSIRVELNNILKQHSDID